MYIHITVGFCSVTELMVGKSLCILFVPPFHFNVSFFLLHRIVQSGTLVCKFPRTSMLVNCCLARDFEILWINDFDASVLRFFKILFGVALQNYLCT